MEATFSDGEREERVVIREPEGASNRHVGIALENCHHQHGKRG
jgi:hypothetical protein